MSIDLIGRVCRDEYNEYDLDTVQLFTKRQLINEYVNIDYIDEDDIESIDDADLMEVAERNNEYLIFTTYYPSEKEYTVFIDKSADLQEVFNALRSSNINIQEISNKFNLIKANSDNIQTIRQVLNKLGIFYDVVEVTVKE